MQDALTKYSVSGCMLAKRKVLLTSASGREKLRALYRTSGTIYVWKTRSASMRCKEFSLLEIVFICSRVPRETRQPQRKNIRGHHVLGLSRRDVAEPPT